VSGEVDAVLVDAYQSGYMLSFFSSKEQSELAFYQAEPVHSVPLFLSCSKFYVNCYDYLDKFNDGLNKLQSSGQYQIIMNKPLATIAKDNE
jgi:ABC-type amino acid transport substrate-binding protein